MFISGRGHVNNILELDCACFSKGSYQGQPRLSGANTFCICPLVEVHAIHKNSCRASLTCCKASGMTVSSDSGKFLL